VKGLVGALAVVGVTAAVIVPVYFFIIRPTSESNHHPYKYLFHVLFLFL